MNTLTNQVLDRINQKPVLYDLYYKKDSQKKPLVIFCHGYKGFKDWGAWHLVAKKFAEADIFFLKFNFSHNGGTVSKPIDFPDLNAFAENNYSKELDDLKSVLDFIVFEEDFASEIDTANISLIGHSRGGGIVLIKAEEDARIKNVLTWAGVSDYKVRFFEGSETFLKWKEEGVTYVENSRTKQQLPHHWQFYKDFINNETRLTIKRAVENLNIPQLIVHGSEDPTVGLKEAEAIHQWNPKSKLSVIERGDHVFGARHPWLEEKLPLDLENAVNQSLHFIKENSK